MKKKISSILGVTLALVLVFSLMGAFLPANTREAEAQAFTPNQWNAMPIPTAGGRVLVAGSVVTDFCLAGDGTTIYLLSGQTGTNNSIAKSTNGGRTFNWLTNPVGFTAPGVIIRVAPDDPETVGVVDSATPQLVFVSETGGATWVNLGDPVASAAAGTADTSEIVSDLAISPLRVGTILDRDYVVSTYDTDNCQVPAVGVPGTWGDIYVVGNSTTWAAVATAAGANYDFTSVALAHNWVGEFGVIAVGSDNVAAGNTEAGLTGDTYLVAINADQAALTPAPTQIILPVNMDTATHDSPCERIVAVQGATENGRISTSDVVLPADFDSTSVGFFKVYLGWKSVSTVGEAAIGGVISNADDVYRVDYNSPRKLEIKSAVAIHSVDYSGLCVGGTLFASESDKSLATLPIGVWWTTNPTSGLPSWEFSYKSPTSVATFQTNCKVEVAADFETSNVAYGGCIGADSAFSKSEDGGLSFNGISMIDEGITDIWDVMPTPGGEYIFIATADNATMDVSLWRCPNQPAIARWDRVHFQTAAQFVGGSNTIIRISPDHEEDSTVYWFDAGGTRLQRSTSNGQIWSTRTAGAAVVDAVVESKDVVYHTSGTNVYISNNGGWSFGLPLNVGIGAISTIAMAPTYPMKPVAGNILFGGTGTVALTTNSCVSFNPMFTWPFTGVIQLLADKDYADNNIVYASSSTTGEGIYRYEVGVSTSWENIRAVAGSQFSGLAMHCGLLYGSRHTVGAAPSGAERALFPTAPAPLWTWDTMTIGATAAIFNLAPSSLRICGDETDVWLYAISTFATDTVFGYNDTMAKASTAANVPAKVSYDPNARASTQFIISWPQISNATAYHAEIYTDEACTGFVTAAGVTQTTAWGPANPAAPSWVVLAGALTPGTNYYFKVRACNQVPGDAIRSQWSAVEKLSVEAGVPIEVPYPSPQLLGPAPGATGVSVNPGFAWGAYHGAEKYEFELGTDPGVTARGYFVEVLVGLTGDAALASTAWQCNIELEYATNYYWHVKAITATGETPWSTGVFTTMAEAEVPVAPPPPVTIPPTPAPITPGWIWGIIIIGAVLVIVVIVLIVVTRRPA